MNLEVYIMCLVKSRILFMIIGVFSVLFVTPCAADGFGKRVFKRIVDKRQAYKKTSLPYGITLIKDLEYGRGSKNKMDVYLPKDPKGAPVIFMVHGGGWKTGDKAHTPVVENKVKWWVRKGFVFVSVNYRLIPEVDPLMQANDVAQALATAQKMALNWGADPSKFILMGHSAGAHLVSILAASPSMARGVGAQEWLGTVSIDTAAFNVVGIMGNKHFGLYDDAFGGDISYWKSVSPFHLLEVGGAPFLAICSTKREVSCVQAEEFVNKATSLGISASIVRLKMSHSSLNKELGDNLGYTSAVDSFLSTLDSSIEQML